MNFIFLTLSGVSLGFYQQALGFTLICSCQWATGSWEVRIVDRLS